MNNSQYGNTVFSFVTMSDIHFSSRFEETSIEAYKKLLTNAQKVTNNTLGAVAITGDFSEGYEKDYDTLINLTAEFACKNVPLFASYGNHEGDGKHHLYKKKFHLPVDNVRYADGYCFIVIGAHAKNAYTDEQVEWVDKQLEREAKENPDKPVFVLIHHAPVGGLVNPDSSVNFIPVFNKYKNVVVICGHDHQREDTLVQEGFIQYRNAHVQVYFPYDEAEEKCCSAAMFYVTDKNYLVIHRYTVVPGTDNIKLANEYAISLKP